MGLGAAKQERFDSVQGESWAWDPSVEESCVPMQLMNSMFALDKVQGRWLVVSGGSIRL